MIQRPPSSIVCASAGLVPVHSHHTPTAADASFTHAWLHASGSALDMHPAPQLSAALQHRVLPPHCLPLCNPTSWRLSP